MRPGVPSDTAMCRAPSPSAGCGADSEVTVTPTHVWSVAVSTFLLSNSTAGSAAAVDGAEPRQGSVPIPLHVAPAVGADEIDRPSAGRHCCREEPRIARVKLRLPLDAARVEDELEEGGLHDEKRERHE